MTRINCIPVEKLIDQHVVAEYREMLRVPAYLRKSKNSGKPIKIPLFYKMSQGHVTFFYDKGLYLQNRHRKLRAEMARRGIQSNFELNLSIFHHYGLMGDWRPDSDAMGVNIERLLERIDGMGEEPRYFGQAVGREWAKELVRSALQ